MIQAYEQAKWRPSDIQYMECHGSGTPVGDAVELAGIHELYRISGCSSAPLSIGSVKSMIGHLLTAAGAAGFIETLLSMNQGILPPSLNFTAPSAQSPLNHSQIRVQTEAEEWKPASPGIPRRAAVSAFGFGGINAHILVEEYRPSSRPRVHTMAQPEKTERIPCVPCALIGMETLLKECDSLSGFTDLIFDKTHLTPELPGSRWRRTDAVPEKKGFFLDEFSIYSGEFHIPPLQMEDILAQHLLLLKAVKGALKDAGQSQTHGR